jgi:hypothetical protein
MLLVGLATVIADGGTAAAASGGANFVATGHDMDYHCTQASGDEAAQECAYFKIVVTKVRNGSSKPILVLDHGTEAKDALVKVGLGPVVTVDPDNAGAMSAVKFTGSSGVPNYSAFIVASDATCGGCDNDPTGEANINARKGDIKTFFNHGGGILALAGAENRDVYYQFVPLLGLTSTAVTAPFTVTTKGAALGITSAMANCCATHNSFELPSAPLVTLETDTAGKAETIAAFNVTIGGGGFTSPPPSGGNHPPKTADMNVTTFENTPVHIKLVASDPDGDSLKYKVIGSPLNGTLSGSAPNLVYTPNTGYLGHDFFAFTVTDGQLTTSQHVVNINVIEPTSTSSPPPLAETGTTARSNIQLGIALLGSGLLLLALGVVRLPRRRRH